MTTDPEAIEEVIQILTQLVRVLRGEVTDHTERGYHTFARSGLEQLLGVRMVDVDLYEKYVRLATEDAIRRLAQIQKTT